MKTIFLLLSLFMTFPFSVVGQENVSLREHLDNRSITTQGMDYDSEALVNHDGKDMNTLNVSDLLNKLKLSGLFQIWYVAGDADTDEVRLRRAELKLKGDLTDNLEFVVMADLSKDTKMLQDIILTLKILGHEVSLGQFKQPLSLEGSHTSASTLEVMERAFSVRELGSRRDRGVKVTGKVDPFKITYIVGLYNGEGKNKDTNDQKDVSGMLIFQPIDQVGLYASAYEGSVGVHADPKRSYIVGAKLEQGAFLVRGEYIEGKEIDTEKKGWYVLASYRLSDLDIEVLRNARLAARYEQWDKDLDDEGEIEVYTLGVQYFLDPKEYNKLSLDYILIDGKENEPDSHGVTFGFQGKF